MPPVFASYETMKIDKLIKTYHELHHQYWDMPYNAEIADVIGEQLVACRWELKCRGYINWDGSIRDDSKAQEYENPRGQSR